MNDEPAATVKQGDHLAPGEEIARVIDLALRQLEARDVARPAGGWPVQVSSWRFSNRWATKAVPLSRPRP